MRTVAPSLALEFRKAQCCSLENVPKQLLKLVEEASQGKKHEKNEAMKIFTFRGHEVDEKKFERARKKLEGKLIHLPSKKWRGLRKPLQTRRTQ